MPLDLDAPILPGVGAAGLVLGADAEAAVAAVGDFADGEKLVNRYVPERQGVRYRSPSVDVWAENGLITQIGVHGDYAGLLEGKIGLGATLGDAQRMIGPLIEDEEDNVAFAELHGVIFEVEENQLLGPYDLNHRIAWIFVYVEDERVLRARAEYPHLVTRFPA